jgi:hypothetical protein
MNAFEKQREIFRKREKKRNEDKPVLFMSSSPDRTLYDEMNEMCERK